MLKVNIMLATIECTTQGYNLHLAEIKLKVAEMLQIPLGEVSVRWQEIDGSKLSPLLAAIEMFRLYKCIYNLLIQ